MSFIRSLRRHFTRPLPPSIPPELINSAEIPYENADPTVSAAEQKYDTAQPDLARRVAADNADGRMQGDVTLFSEEDLRQYREGGYNPVALGDIYKERYTIIRKLGFGQTSTVWLAFDSRLKNHVTLKILKADRYCSTRSRDQLKVLQYIRSKDSNHPGRENCIDFLDSFTHSGPYGTHMCMVSEPMYQDLASLTLISGDWKLPLIIVKEVSRQLLLALDYLHTSCKMIHTDIQLGNILVSLRDGDFESFIKNYLQENPQKLYDGRYGELPAHAIATDYTQLPLPDSASQFVFKLAGLGVVPWVNGTTDEPIQTLTYRAPEVVIGVKWDSSIDIWNLGCIIWELLTGRYLFGGAASEEGGWSAEEDHLSEIIKLFGPVPLELIIEGKNSTKYFDSFGHLKNIHDVPHIPLGLVIKYDCPKMPLEEIRLFKHFIRCMLKFRPSDRKTALEMLDHRWLEEAE